MLGNLIASQIRAELKERITSLESELNITPGLAVILVGGRRDSATYVRMKKKACAEVGIRSISVDYPSEVTQEELIAKGNLVVIITHRLSTHEKPPYKIVEYLEGQNVMQQQEN